MSCAMSSLACTIAATLPSFIPNRLQTSMNLLSLDFAGYFLLFFVGYWLLQPSAWLQNMMLLLASLGFMAMVSPEALLVLLAWTTLIWLLGGYIRRGGRRSIANTLLIIMVVGFFFVFKYYHAMQDTLDHWRAALGLGSHLPVMEMLAPLGLSFYVFHSISYIVSLQRTEEDKGRGALPFEHIDGRPDSFFGVLLYLSFFPSIVAGPINRAAQFFPQLMPLQPRQLEQPARAIGLIVLAMVKLFLISDYLDKHLVAPIFSAPTNASPLASLTAVLAYAWQIYMNFSGYTNLVTGIALLLGFQLPRNFNAPYLALDLKEFWGRWHMSLSQFIRDYIYIPLGGSRCGALRQNANVFIAMVLSGIWHGAGLNFVLWGALHGAGLVVVNVFQQGRSGPHGKRWLTFPAPIARLLTFAFICLTWVFFRANNVDDATTLLDNIGHITPSMLVHPSALIMWALVLIVMTYRWIEKGKLALWKGLAALPLWAYPLCLIAVITLIFMLAPAGTPGFIYANF